MNLYRCIFFDPFSITFISSSKSINDKLNSFFAGYECDRTPDLTVRIDACGSMPDSVLGRMETSIPEVVGHRFDIGPGIIRGIRNPELNLISIEIHDDFFLQPTQEIFQAFLYLVYHTLCYEHQIKSCFIHGCGLIHKHRPFLFVGPHGSGKTALGRLSKGCVMHDDQMLLKVSEDRIYINSPPLAAKDDLRSFRDRSMEIDKIYMLHKDTACFLKDCSSQRAFLNLYNEIVLPLTLLPMDIKFAKKTKLDLCNDILQSVKVLELHFTLDLNFNTCLV